MDALAPIQHTATYELVVEQIRRVIYLGRYLPGDKLPPERELAQKLGVSRTTLREAIRLLEGENLILVKRGATGGIVVSEQGISHGPDRQSLTTAQQQALREIFEYRLAIEGTAARLAALKRSAAELQAIVEAVDAMDALAAETDASAMRVAEFTAADTRFHLLIAQAARNRHFVRAVEEIRASMFRPVGSIFERLSEQVNEHHRPIVEAIAAKDAERAEALMREHIEVALRGLARFLPGAAPG